MLPSDPYQSPKPSFPRPVPVPDAEPDDEPLMTVCYNRDWAAVLLGACTQLLQLATWDTSDPDVALLAQNRAMLLIDMLAGDTANRIEPGVMCMPEFRIVGDCVLEVNCGTSESPDWQSVLTGSNPSGMPTVPYPPDTPQYEDDTARCIAAANISAQLKYGTETLANDAAIVGGIAVALIDLLGAFLFFVPGGVLVDIAIAIINLAVGHVASDFSSDLPAIDWDSVRDELSCLLDRDGVLTEAGRTAFLAWMADQYSGNLAWALTVIIVQNVSASGLTTDARMPQNTIAVDECAACGAWTHTFDFTTGEHGWSVIGNPYSVGGGCYESEMGYYEAGVGYRTAASGHGVGTEAYQVHISYPIATRFITEVVITTYGTPDYAVMFHDDGCTGEVITGYAPSNPIVMAITPDDFTDVIAGIHCVNTSAVLIGLSISGTGGDPYA